MKRLLVLALVVAIGLAGTLAYGQGNPGQSGKQGDVNALRQFQKETLPLRDEMQAKRFELRDELGKQNPDRNRVAQLQKEMIDLRTKIQTAAEKNGVPEWGYGPRGGRGGRGYGPGMRGYQGCGYGPQMMGYGLGGDRGYGPGNRAVW